jgi:predicted CXXCH cytochrome family protein
MNERTLMTVVLLVAVVLLLSSTFAYRAFAQTEIRIDSAASCTTACHTDFFKKKHIHPGASKGTTCVKCHKPVEPGKHAFKPTPANKSEQCYACHDEDEFKSAAVHKPVQAGSCTKCHDPHQSDQAKLLRKPAPQLCFGCHDEDEFKGAAVHKPVQAGSCTKCHDPHKSDQPRLLRKPAPQLCFGCHDEDEFKGKVVHGPAAEGKCLDCHRPHAAENKRLLASKAPELCFTCHAAQLKDAEGRTLPATKSLFDNKEATLHPPFAKGQCSFCHRPHASESGRLLTKAYPADFYAGFNKDAYGLCFSCHDSEAFEMPRTLTETQFRNGNLNLHHRHVNRDKGRSCGACHDPHGSTQPRLIHPSFQFGSRILPLKFEKTETGGNCAAACHIPIKYDRCEPEAITMRTSARSGADASLQELQQACDKKK